MKQIKKILFILILLISSLVSQVLAEGVSCYRSEIRTKSNGGSVLLDDVNVEGELSDHQRNMQNYVGQAMRQGQQDFLKHPVTKATANALLFVATGGVDGLFTMGRALVGMVGAAKSGTNLVDDVARQAKSWLGKDYKAITNKAGDNIFMSKNGLKKIRFDIKNPHGDAPHIHFEIFKNGKWKDAIPGTHRIYPKPN